MRFDNVSICSVAHVDAPRRVGSAELEALLEGTMRRLGIPKGMLEGLSGIVERRVWDEGIQPSDAATLAAERAIAQAGIDRRRLGVLISTSVCRDFIEPSTACLVHGKLGLDPHCINFDLGNACLGFLNGMEVVGNMIERGQLDYGIVVDGENSKFVVDSTIARLQGPEVDKPTFWANFATLTLGSSGVAMVLARRELAPEAHPFLGGVTVAATEHRDLCRGQVDQMLTNSPELLTAGLELATRTWQVAEQELGWTREGIDEFVMHQVSKAHTVKLGATLQLDPAKILTTYAEYGNVGPAGIPLVLSKAAELGRLERGDRVALMGIGSGLNCSMAELVW
jgi:3-oxoacyl-[acyl-carrier-protein] synthase-3